MAEAKAAAAAVQRNYITIHGGIKGGVEIGPINLPPWRGGGGRGVRF